MSDRVCNVQKSWRSEERWTAVSAKDFQDYEKFMGAMTNILHEGRREGARCFCVAGDLNIDLGLMCTDEELQFSNALWLFLVLRRKMSEQTATPRSGRWKRVKEKLCHEVSPNMAELERQEETMSEVALVAAQSMMLNVNDEDVRSTDHTKRNNKAWVVLREWKQQNNMKRVRQADGNAD